jgi:DNA-binding beta-propeller fold protein YncE
VTFAVVAAFVTAPALSSGRVAEAQSPPSWTLLVANREDATVSPVDVATRVVGAPIDVVDRTPEGIAITPDGATAFVTGAAGVTPIDVETRTAGATIEVPGNPEGVAITPDGTTAFVTANTAGTVTPIDVATRSAGPPIMVAAGGGASAVAITPDGRTAFVTVDNLDGRLIPVDIATRTPGAPIPVGPFPDGPAITPDGATLFVANGDPEGPGIVTPVDVSTRTAGTPIPVHPLADTVAITPDGTTALAASVVPPEDAPPDSANVVTPIDVATRTAGPPIPVDDRPSSIAITPDGATAFVGNFTFEGTPLTTIQPIDLATRTVGARITVGRNPSALAITPDQAPVAKLSVTPGFAGQPTEFDASASTVRFGTITSYAWDFGDGSPPVTTSTATTTHVYAAPGSYTVRVTETDSAGTSTTKVFTGQTMSRRGDPSAIATAIVQILAVPRFTG